MLNIIDNICLYLFLFMFAKRPPLMTEMMQKVFTSSQSIIFVYIVISLYNIVYWRISVQLLSLLTTGRLSVCSSIVFAGQSFSICASPQNCLDSTFQVNFGVVLHLCDCKAWITAPGDGCRATHAWPNLFSFASIADFGLHVCHYSFNNSFV